MVPSELFPVVRAERRPSFPMRSQSSVLGNACKSPTITVGTWVLLIKSMRPATDSDVSESNP